MSDKPERIPLKARVRATFGFDPDDPTPNQVTTFSGINDDPMAAERAIYLAGNVTVTRDDPMAVRLDLGAGRIVRPGHIPLGRGYGSEIFPLGYRSETVDEIVASHVLEHFPFGQVKEVLRDWIRALKPGGRLRIAVPDFWKIASQYFASPDSITFGLAQRRLMGGQSDENDFHRSIFDFDRLYELMQSEGLRVVGRWQSEIVDCARDEISLNLEGRKP